MNLPKISIRPFTSDQYQLDRVFYSNYYQIKGFKDGDFKPTILDIGAHCGFSTFSFLALGAKKVFAFEVHPDNYKLLLENISPFEDKVISWNLGIYVENLVLPFPTTPELKDNIYYDYSDVKLAETDYAGTSIQIPVFTLDYILKNLIFESIDILKISIGYTEIEILEKSDLVLNIPNICLETDQDDARINQFLENMKVKGFINSHTKKSEEDGKTLILLSKKKLSDIFLI